QRPEQRIARPWSDNEVETKPWWFLNRVPGVRLTPGPPRLSACKTAYYNAGQAFPRSIRCKSRVTGGSAWEPISVELPEPNPSHLCAHESRRTWMVAGVGGRVTEDRKPEESAHELVFEEVKAQLALQELQLTSFTQKAIALLAAAALFGTAAN